MFTGLIEEIGIVEAIVKGEKSLILTIKGDKVLQGLNIGDSVSTNGVCLTVTHQGKSNFNVDVMWETMERSSLRSLSPGDKVNLERAMRADSRFGGHIVSGHIDGVGRITSFVREDNAVWVTIRAEENLLRYIVEKGSIAIDGISLTVAYVDDEQFKVSIIPHTSKETTLIDKSIGDMVNLECDVIGKYVEKLLGFNHEKSKKSNITEDFLKSNGFM